LACSVGGASITFTNPEHARLIGEALNLSYSGNIVHIRTGHPFQSFVSRFDRGESKQMRRLKITTAASTL
jgi:hypothetical protein